MGFGSGSVSYRRFFISGEFPRTVDDEFVETIRSNVFGKHGSATPDGKVVGWLAPDQLFDTDITLEKVAFDRFAYLQMRIDSLAAPAAVVRSYIRQEEAAEREASGSQRLNKSQRQQARERAIARSEKEASAGAYRRISVVPVMIDLSARTVYFGNLGAAASDKFLILFRDTFDATLEPAGSEHLAYRIMEAAGDPRSIEDAQPFHLVSSAGVVEDDFDFDDRSFFGREFLTWLWYMSDAGTSTYQVGRDSLSVAISGVMRLDCDFRMTGSDMIRCDAPARAPESRAAIAIGKQPVKAGLILGGRAGDYSLILDGPAFNVSGLRLPESENADRRGRLEERFTQVTEVAGMLDTLFGLFLGGRASLDRPKDAAAMKSWASGGQSKTTKRSTGNGRAKSDRDADEPRLNAILPFHAQTTEAGR